MAGAIRTRPIIGEARAPGRGVVWMRMDGEVILGTPASPFAKACLFADFGNGVGSATHAEAWSYANLDISIQFFRRPRGERSEEHTSELQSLMRISYAVFCLKKKKTEMQTHNTTNLKIHNIKIIRQCALNHK